MTDTLVIDSGTATCKAGIPGDDSPTVLLPTVIGRPVRRGSRGFNKEDVYFGEEAECRGSELHRNYPIEKGIVSNWEDMEKIWNYVYYDLLKFVPEEHPVLVTEKPLNPRQDREKLAEVFFETFLVPSLHINNQSVLSLYSSGLINGCVIDSGESVTHVAPVSDGYLVPSATVVLDFGGRQVTDLLVRILTEKDLSMDGADDRAVAKDIKETLCYVAQDFDKECDTARSTVAREMTYELPDGTQFVANEERFRCTEALFQPSLIGSEESRGLTTGAFHAISGCDQELRRGLFENLVLAGGNSLFPGIAERLRKDLAALAPPGVDVGVAAPPGRRFSAWLGGTIIASTQDFPAVCVSREDYSESGAAIVHSRCPV